MDRKTAIRLLVVIASIILMVVFLYPSFIYYSKPLPQREEYIKTHPDILKKIVNLGLDLQGGMRLVLEIDRTNIDKTQDKDPLDRAFTVIENRINGLGVAEPSIQKQGKDRIIVELPGLKDEKRAKDIIGQTAQLEFMLLRDPVQLEQAINVIDHVIAGKALRDSALTGSVDTSAQKARAQQALAEKLFKGEEKDTSMESDTADSAAMEEEEAVSFKDLLVGMEGQIAVRMNNVGRVNDILVRKDVREALERVGLGSNKFLWGHDTVAARGGMLHRSLYYVKGTPEMRGDAIKDAAGTMDPNSMRGGGAKVDLEMNSRGAKRFSAVTAVNVNKFLAIVLDSTVYSAPRIIQKISGGRAEITGSFSITEANNLAVVLRAGALPAPVRIIEERTVGPSLGQDSIRKSVIAGIVGGILVIFFILIYYQLSGAIAVFTIILNILGVLAVMAGLNATLTLPGIAGILLQIGMGVDANVLIYERIREELRAGKTVRASMKAGFERAFVTIIDSNLTTIATALILFWKGTGAIKGFALTLTFGLTVSLYLALFVTKVLMEIMFSKAKEKMSI
ncbi:MAG: protein translocase subunit SecD [Chitinispirillaceae bacterium]|nr:protein translocase subunit SecD [Chitinispirillaceae bacterium]